MKMAKQYNNDVPIDKTCASYNLLSKDFKCVLCVGPKK